MLISFHCNSYNMNIRQPADRSYNTSELDIKGWSLPYTIIVIRKHPLQCAPLHCCHSFTNSIMFYICSFCRDDLYLHIVVKCVFTSSLLLAGALYVYVLWAWNQILYVLTYFDNKKSWFRFWFRVFVKTNKQKRQKSTQQKLNLFVLFDCPFFLDHTWSHFISIYIRRTNFHFYNILSITTDC